MKRFLLRFAIFSACALLIAGCSKNNPIEPKVVPQTGKLTLTMNAIQDVASGSVTITKGSQNNTQPIIIANSSASATFDAVEAGTWSISVILLNSDHMQLYAGTGTATITQGKLTVAEISVGTTTGTLIVKVNVTGTQLLWNKLGSDTEVLTSQSGPNGVLNGNFIYSPVKYGNGATNSSSGGSFISFDNSCFDANKGTIEFWFKTNFSVNNGKIQGDSTFNQKWFSQNGDAADYLTIGFKNGQFSVFSQCQLYSISLQSVPVSWSANEVHHFALTYDFAFSSPYYTVSLFIDGYHICDAKAVHSGEGFTYNKGIEPVKILLNDINYSKATLIDNIKMWDYPKTDFSDRFGE